MDIGGSILEFARWRPPLGGIRVGSLLLVLLPLWGYFLTALCLLSIRARLVMLIRSARVPPGAVGQLSVAFRIRSLSKHIPLALVGCLSVFLRYPSVFFAGLPCPRDPTPQGPEWPFIFVVGEVGVWLSLAATYSEVGEPSLLHGEQFFMHFFFFFVLLFFFSVFYGAAFIVRGSLLQIVPHEESSAPCYAPPSTARLA